MKRTFLLFLLCLLLCSPAHAGLKAVGRGDAMQLDPSGFSPEMKDAYKFMKAKCVKCHTLERTVIALQTGLAPISGGVFDRNATRAYGIKMLRKPDSNMTKEDVKIVVALLNYLLDLAAK